MKKIVLLLTMLPLVGLADVPVPPHYYRYQRIGYEVLPDAEALIRENAWGLGLLTVVVSVLIGMLVCLCARKAWCVKICSKLLLVVTAVFAWVVRTFHCLTAGVFLLSLFLILKTGADTVLLLACLSTIALTVIPVIFRRRIEKAFPILFRRKIKVASFVCAVIIMAWFVWWLFDVFDDNESYVDKHGEVPIYEPAPGWKYPTELSGKEQADFNSKLNSLPLRMQELIETKWRKDPANGSDDHAKTVVLEVLRSDAELKSACIGIPVELIVSHYFKTEKYRERYDRFSFTHPRTVPWTRSRFRDEAEHTFGDADVEWK